MPDEQGAWHLDRKVPVAIILSLVVQTAGLVWWAASLSGRQDEHSRRISQLEAADARQATESQRVSEALARMDERMLAQTRILQRIEEQLSRGAR